VSVAHVEREEALECRSNPLTRKVKRSNGGRMK
jgi:hypothetical protein